MKKFITILILTILFTSPLVALPGEAKAEGFVHKLLFYLPNRVCDVFDLVRACGWVPVLQSGPVSPSMVNSR